jgi:hypothetical protein
MNNTYFKNPDAVLCYVEGSNLKTAYFTTQELSKQWGDDWDDAPWEHNAGIPYISLTDEWEIESVVFQTDLVLPDTGYANSPYSVRDINQKQVPWLAQPGWELDCFVTPIDIYAGTKLRDFVYAIQCMGGKIFSLIPQEALLITADDLVRLEYCEWQCERFATLFPHGLTFNRANLLKASDQGMDVDFLIFHMLSYAGTEHEYREFSQDNRQAYYNHRNPNSHNFEDWRQEYPFFRNWVISLIDRFYPDLIKILPKFKIELTGE